MTRYAYFIDLSLCAGCESCTVACQTKNGLEPDQVYTKVSRSETGSFPDVRSTFVISQCMHCENPPCVDVCPTGASYKTAEGPVLVTEQECIACKYCMTACPYDARIYDGEEHVVKKCTECFDRLSAGQQPACVQTCLTGARTVGDLDDPTSPIHTKIGQPGTFKVEGTSFYLRPPEGIPREMLPRNFQAAGITFAWQSILQPAGQLIMGGALAAVLASLAANAVKSARKGGAEHGEH